MALNTEVGTLTAPGGTGNDTITLDAGFDPKAIIMWAGYNTTDGQTNGPGRYSMGFGSYDGATVQQCYYALQSSDALSPSQTGRVSGTTALLIGCTTTAAGAPTVDYEVRLVSMSATSVVVNWFDLPSTASIVVNYLILGGSDISAAYAHAYLLPSSGTTHDVTIAAGWGQPDLLLGAYYHANQNPDQFFHWSFGAAKSNTVRRTTTVNEADNVATMALYATQRDAFLTAVNLNSSGALTDINLSAEASWPTDGYQLTFGVALGQYRVCALALKGTVQSSMGGVSTSTTTNGTVDFAAGFTPSAALVWGYNMPTDPTGFSADSGSALLGAFGIGAYDGTNEGFAGWAEDDGAATSNTGNAQSSTKGWQSLDPAASGAAAPTLSGEADLSFSGDNVRFTWTDADTVVREVNVLALGSTVPEAVGNRLRRFL